MASEDYIKASRLAKTAYRKAVAAGEYPYLPALDDMINNQDVRTEETLGLVSIPLDRIVGMKTAGRKQSFASNFMPLTITNGTDARREVPLTVIVFCALLT